jgi:glycosyltransferase involved in cell wall biosynthesis
MSYTQYRTLILIVAYNAEQHITSVLDRIPESIWNGEAYNCDILVIDDFSSDATWQVCNDYCERNSRQITIFRTPSNQGYGGNQKLGYTYALKNGFDAVVLLHGDGQYAPELLPEIIKPLAEHKAEVVLGTRMAINKNALKGGMPLYKFIANIALTGIQNTILGSHFSEFHTGYRAYSTSALKRIPFLYNSDWFDFDTDIIIQIIDQNISTAEIPIPTHYGDEICHVDNLRYGIAILKSCLQSRVQRYGIFYHHKFDYKTSSAYEGVRDNYYHYENKSSFDSSHSYALSLVSDGETIIDVGCGEGYIARALHSRGCIMHGIDSYTPADLVPFASFTQINLSQGIEWKKIWPKTKCDVILLLDIVEHLDNPEEFMENIFQHIKGTKARIIITTPNIAFVTVRFMLLLGYFQYGNHGILDKTHKRLFTFSSLKRLMEQSGFVIDTERGIPVPFPLAFGSNSINRHLLTVNKWLIALSKGLFSFQIGMVLKPIDDFETVFLKTIGSKNKTVATRGR